MFHITITKDGETKLDLDTKVIIGAFDQDEDTTAGFALIDKASPVELAAVIDAAESEIKSLLEQEPAVALHIMMAKFRARNEKKAEAKDEPDSDAPEKTNPNEVDFMGMLASLIGK
jgi:hypothetical protein